MVDGRYFCSSAAGGIVWALVFGIAPLCLAIDPSCQRPPGSSGLLIIVGVIAVVHRSPRGKEDGEKAQGARSIFEASRQGACPVRLVAFDDELRV
jgi:hypothetical protein